MKKLLLFLLSLLPTPAMPNEYFNASGAPSTGAALVSSTMRTEFSNIAAGFDKLPALTGNGSKAVIVNSGATALTVTTGTLTLAGNLVTSGTSSLTLTTTAATNVTLPTTGTLATLAGTETFTNKTLTSPTLTTPTVSSGSLTVTGGTITTGAATALSLATTGGTSVQIANKAAMVTYLEMRGDSTGGVPYIIAKGETNTGLDLASNGTGSVRLMTQGGSAEQVRITNVNSAVNYVELRGASTGNQPVVMAAGSDANVGLDLNSKGTGSIRLMTNNGATEQVRVTHTASATAPILMTGGTAGAAASIDSTSLVRWPSGLIIGTDSTNNKIDDASSGAGTATLYIGNASINVTSDVRLKKDIEDTKANAWELIDKSRVVDHTWNDPSDTAPNNRNTRGKFVGLIAQEQINVTPWAVNKPWKEEDHWFIEHVHLVPLLIKGAQETHAKVRALEDRLAKLERRAR